MTFTALPSLNLGNSFQKFHKSVAYRIKEGFSLVEVLVVMTIISVLAALSWAGFYGMRTSMMLHQTAETFRSDVVYAQRSAMLLDRQAGENWIYGIGVDISTIETTGKYRLFKWCASGSTYLDFDPARNLPNPSSDCLSEGTFNLAGKSDVSIQVESLRVCTDAIDTGNAAQDIGYILFESVTGKVHFYRNASGATPRQRVGSVEWARITFDRNGRYDSVVINNEGVIELQEYDPNVSSPCPAVAMAAAPAPSSVPAPAPAPLPSPTPISPLPISPLSLPSEEEPLELQTGEEEILY